MPKLLLILVDVQGIYVDKIYPNFYEKILPRSAPLGASKKNFAYFVSDWTGDSHLTHYLTSKRWAFDVYPTFKVFIYTICSSLSNL